MALPPTRYFPFRRNKDGSIDTICPKCFSIVANVKTEAEAVEYNQEHVCDATNTWDRGCLKLPEKK
jgi:hypothetical protein